MKYILALIASFGILILYLIIAEVIGKGHGGRAILMLILFLAMVGIWRTIVFATADQVPPTNNQPSAGPATTVAGQYAVALASNGDTNKATQAIDRPEPIDEDRVYRQIAEELETGATDKGMWTRLFSECGGDEKQIKVMYIKQRAERLIAAERLRLEQAARENVAETSKIEEGGYQPESETQHLLKPAVVKRCPYCREEVLPTSDYCMRCGKYFTAS